MYDNTAHAISGICTTVPYSNESNFNPRRLDLATQDLMEYAATLSLSKYSDIAFVHEDNPETHEHVSHEYNEEDNEITITEDSALATAVSAIPDGWDVTVVVDDNENLEGFYGVCGAVDCGGGIDVRFKTLIRGSVIEELKIVFPELSDDVFISTSERVGVDLTRDETPEYTSLGGNIPMSGRYLARVMRSLNTLSFAGYALFFESPTLAYEYIAAEHTPVHRNRNSDKYHEKHSELKSIYNINQGMWANLRDVKQRTVTNNLSDARNRISSFGWDNYDDPMPKRAVKESDGPAFAEGTEEDKQSAFVVLV